MTVVFIPPGDSDFQTRGNAGDFLNYAACSKPENHSHDLELQASAPFRAHTTSAVKPYAAMFDASLY